MGPKGTASARRAAAAMEAAREAGRPFAAEPAEKLPLTRNKFYSDFSTPVFCYRAGSVRQCLPGCDRHLQALSEHDPDRCSDVSRQPISGIRSEALPSGHGIAIIPTKLWMHRSRQGGQVYKPDVEATQLDWSTEAFLDVIEKRLTRGRSGRQLPTQS
jgi:hypothetical protein